MSYKLQDGYHNLDACFNYSTLAMADVWLKGLVSFMIPVDHTVSKCSIFVASPVVPCASCFLLAVLIVYFLCASYLNCLLKPHSLLPTIVRMLLLHVLLNFECSLPLYKRYKWYFKIMFFQVQVEFIHCSTVKLYTLLSLMGQLLGCILSHTQTTNCINTQDHLQCIQFSQT